MSYVVPNPKPDPFLIPPRNGWNPAKPSWNRSTTRFSLRSNSPFSRNDRFGGLRFCAFSSRARCNSSVRVSSSAGCCGARSRVNIRASISDYLRPAESNTDTKRQNEYFQCVTWSVVEIRERANEFANVRMMKCGQKVKVVVGQAKLPSSAEEGWTRH